MKKILVSLLVLFSTSYSQANEVDKFEESIDKALKSVIRGRVIADEQKEEIRAYLEYISDPVQFVKDLEQSLQEKKMKLEDVDLKDLLQNMKQFDTKRFSDDYSAQFISIEEEKIGDPQ